ncbi:MAG: VacB/RNase II family 3'-5' exoribonuclease [Sandaracinus sp.]|nr:VacB/RNase II family 3'-5' exoribonuclease [Sandaracinus sp.]
MTSIDRESLLGVLRDAAPRALHVGEICQRLELPKGARDAALDALDELVTLGLIGEMPGNRFRARRQAPAVSTLAPATAGVVSGVLHMTPRGFGFVGAEDGGPDVFVPPDSVGPALHGDRVEVAARPSAKGREGTVLTVLARRNPRFTGTLEQHGKTLVIQPDDPRLRGPILLLGKPPKEKRNQVAVIAELVRFPQGSDELASATVVEVLGVQGLTRVEVAKIKIREGIVEDFDEETAAEARAFGDRVANVDKQNREDLRELDLVTIDPPDARDHDDAVFVEKNKGGYRVVVAIADVAHYVRPGTALDRTALARGCSIYLPDRAIPMLPPELSTNLASLVPNKDRLCLGVEIQLRKNGAVASHRLFEGVMKSGGHLTYDGVARALGLTEEGARQPAAEKRLPMLHVLADLAKKLRAERLRRGALDFDLPEAKVKLDEANVEPIDCVRSRKDPGIREAYRMIEELMLLANEVVAGELKRLNVPAIYRIHGKPDEKKVSSFAKVATALGHSMDVEAARDPQKLSAFLREIEDSDEAPVLRYLLLRAMQQAAYDVNGDVGHFGLAAKDYLHFTSPIRRYPDLVVHRVVRSIVRNEPVDGAALLPRMRRAAVEASRLERRAMQVERDVVSLYRAILMRDRVGETFEGSISSVDANGFWVALDEPFVDVLVPLEKLGDYFELDELGIRLIGLRTGRMLALGQRFEVTIEDVRIPRREIVGVPTDESLLGDPRRDGGNEPPRRARGDDRGRSDGGRGRGERREHARRERTEAAPPGERRRDRRAARRAGDEAERETSGRGARKPSAKKGSAINHASPFEKGKPKQKKGARKKKR